MSEESNVLPSLKRACSPKCAFQGEKLTLCDVDVMLSRHPRPHFMCPNNDNSKTQPIVLIQPYSEIVRRNTILSESFTPVSNKNKNSSTDFNVTGSPLRLVFNEDTFNYNSPFTIKAPIKNNNLGPAVSVFHSNAFDFKTASRLCTKLHSIINQGIAEDEEYLPIYLLLDSKDSRKTLFLGMTPGCSPRSRSNCWYSGPFSSQEEVPQLQQIKGMLTGAASATLADISACSVYQVVPFQKEDEQCNDNDSTLLQIVCCWDKPIGVLCNPPPDATSTLVVKVGADGCSGPLSKDLRALSYLLWALSNGETHWGEDEGDISVRLQQFLDDHQMAAENRSQVNKIQNSNQTTPEFDDVISGTMQDSRSDFMYSLWSVMSECCSVQSIRWCLLQVFSTLQSGTLRPLIHFRDSTKVAMKARSIIKGDEDLPLELSGPAPLSLLVEMGVSIVARDLASTLQAGGLATQDEVTPFLSPLRTEMTAEDYRTALLGLQKMHLSLHVVCVLRKQLRLHSNVLATYCTQMLSELLPMKQDVLAKKTDFSFSLQTSHVTNLLEKLTPVLWKVMMRTSEGTSSFRSLSVSVSRVPLVRRVDPKDVLPELDTSDRRDSSQCSYYCTHHVTVQDSFFSANNKH